MASLRRPARWSWRDQPGGRRLLLSVPGRSVADLALRQRLLQFCHARIGDLCEGEVERPQLRQPLQVHQPRVGDPTKTK